MFPVSNFRFRNSLLWVALAVFAVAGPLAAEMAKAASGDGRIIYGQGTSATSQTRIFDATSVSYQAASSTIAATATIMHTVAKGSPIATEYIVGQLASTGTLDILCFDGVTWTKDLTFSVGANGNTRRFDIEYESVSGTPMVLYSRNVSGANELGYRRKATAGCGSGNWTSEVTLDSARIVGTALWVELEARGSDNAIAAAFSDSNATQGGYLSAMIWDGSSWGNEPGAALDTSLELEGTAGANGLKVFDIAWEATSGELLAAWGNSAGKNGTNGVRYATCTTGTLPCTWSATLTPSTFADDASVVDLAADPASGSNKVLFASVGNAASDFQAGAWDGSSWNAVGANLDTSAIAVAPGDQTVAIGWLTSGSSTRGIIVYGDGTNPTLNWDWFVYDPSAGTFTQQTDVNNQVAMADEQSIALKINPDDLAKLVVATTDANSDLWSKQVRWDGAQFYWTDTEGGSSPLEATISTIAGTPFDFVYERFQSPEATSITNDSDGTLGDGGRIGHQITVNGSGFGSGPCNGASNKLSIGTYDVPCGDVSAWSLAQITFTVPSGVNVYGGSGTDGLTVRARGGNDLTPLVLYVYPDITAVTVPTSICAGGNCAREYDGADAAGANNLKDGEIVLTGTRFGTAGSITIHGVTATQAANASFCSGSAYTDTCIVLRVPSGIADNSYLGDILLSRTTPADSKSDTWTGFRVLPRIASISVNTGIEGDSIVLTGNHFCQSGSCLAAASWNTANDNVKYNAVLATVTGTPSHTSIATTVPDSTNGSIVLTSSAYASNGMTFTYKPNGQSVANTDEGSLTDGGRIGQKIVITGTNFGSGPSDGCSTACVKIGSYTVPDGDISCWNSGAGDCAGGTKIAFTIPSGINVYGGSAGDGLVVRANTLDDPSAVTHYVYPDITAITVQTSICAGGNCAREYDASDSSGVNNLKDGEIVLTGTRFGTAGAITIHGQTATQAANASFCGGSAYTDTCIVVQVPTAIADNSYTGSVIITRSLPADSRTDTWTGFRVLPRISSLTPSSGAVGSTTDIAGNHLCQNGGVCPVSQDANSKVTFNGTQAATFASWSDTAITGAEVPIGATSGPVVVTSNTYTSNGKAFTVAVASPSDPTSKEQRLDGQGAVISTGSGVSATTIDFKMTSTSGVTGGTMYGQVEVQPIGTPFTSPAGACSAPCYQGPSVSYSGGSQVLWVDNIGSGTFTDGSSYHWQARARYNYSATDYYSNWVSYPDTPNAESAVDFYIDTTAPTISLGTDSTCATASSGITDLTATIVWSTSDATSGAEPPPGAGAYATKQVDYIQTSLFDQNWGTDADVATTSLGARENSPHTVNLTGLVAGAGYTFRVRSKDAVANEAKSQADGSSSGCTFTTAATRPVKTVEHFITQQTGDNSGTVIVVPFTVNVPESPSTEISVKSAIIEISGVSASGSQTIYAQLLQGTHVSGDYSQVTAAAYSLDSTGAVTPFSIYLNGLNPTGTPPGCSGCQSVSNITTGGTSYDYTLFLNGTAVPTSLLSAKLILTYTYVP